MVPTIVCGCGQGGDHCLVVREGPSEKVIHELRDLNDGKAPVVGRFEMRVSWAGEAASTKS